jgi:hypothetical protein
MGIPSAFLRIPIKKPHRLGRLPQQSACLATPGSEDLEIGQLDTAGGDLGIEAADGFAAGPLPNRPFQRTKPRESPWNQEVLRGFRLGCIIETHLRLRR